MTSALRLARNLTPLSRRLICVNSDWYRGISAILSRSIVRTDASSVEDGPRLIAYTMSDSNIRLVAVITLRFTALRIKKFAIKY